MNRILLVVLFIFASSFSSAGQIRIIDKKGKAYDGFGGSPFNLGEEIFRYRIIHDRYPNNKYELLDFIHDKDREESVDSVYLDYFYTRNEVFTKLIKSRRNNLIVADDTCLFYNAKTKQTIQCIGGVADLQKYDSDQFRFWKGSHFYDRNGKYLWSLCEHSPFLPSIIKDIKSKFVFVVTMKPRKYNDSNNENDEIFIEKEEDRLWTTPVFIPVTMTRGGTFFYDLSCLEGIQLYYQVYGNPFDPANTIGPITIEEAIDQQYFETIKASLKDFMEKFKDVYSIQLWELILFNVPSNAIVAQ